MDAIKDWTLRISQADHKELLLITFELLQYEMVELKETLSKDEDYKAQHQRVVKVLNYLIDTLDMEQPVSYELVTLYTYIHKLMVQVVIKKDLALMDRALGLVETIYKGFEKASEKELEGTKLMGNTQKVYAGLTYNQNNALNETMLQDQNRGFMA